MTADREALVAEVAGTLAGSHFVIHDHTPPAIGEHIHLSPQAAAHLADALADLLAAREQQARAEAWDEGYGQAGLDMGPYQYRETTNPHREADA